MHAVRRLYVYFISAVSLTMLAIGTARLLAMALDQIWIGLGGATVVQGDPIAIRRQASLFIALVVVALPIWLFHWWRAERAVVRPGGDPERRSTIRAFYLTAGLLVPFFVWLGSSVDLIQRTVNAILGVPSPVAAGNRIPFALAIILVAGTIWIYHARVRIRDMRGGGLEQAAVWLPRLYLYVAAFAGAMLLLFGTAGLIRLIVDALLGTGVIVASANWWIDPLTTGIALVVVGLLAWGIHWSYSLHLLRAGDWRAESEQRSALRRVYLYAIVLVGVFVTFQAASSSLETLFRAVLGVPEVSQTGLFARRLVEPLLAAIPFSLFWWYHWRRIAREARQYAEVPLRRSMHRLYTYGVALVGLAFASVGLAYVIGIVIDLVLGGTRTVSVTEELWRGRVSQFAALAVVGAAAWLLHWYAAQRQLAADPSIERETLTRRVYLYLIAAASLVALTGSLAVVVYRVLLVVLGVVELGTLISTISAALGVVIVAGILLAYHGLILRQEVTPLSPGPGSRERIPA